MLQSDHAPDVDPYIAGETPTGSVSGGDETIESPDQELAIVVPMEAARTRSATLKIVKRTVPSPSPIIDSDFDESEAT